MAEEDNIALSTDLLAEASLWRSKVTTWLGDGARLIHVSRDSSDIRLYRLGDRVLKARRLTPASVVNRPNALEDEFHLMRRMSAQKGLAWEVSEVTRYICEAGWESFEMTAIDPPLTLDPVLFPVRETLADIWSLSLAVWRLNLAGISHGDLTPANAGRNSAGRFVLIDLDQAVFAFPLWCLLRDFLGVPCGGKPSQYTVWDRFCRVRYVRSLVGWRDGLRRKLRELRRRPGNDIDSLVIRARARGDAALGALAQCWQDAAVSDANSPGVGVAYYSMDLRGFHFSGERPWMLRWEMLSRTISFQGKRVFELGCNLGLLGIHARLQGAAKVVATDHNRRVLDAAGNVARLLGAEVEFRRVDFDRDSEWEGALGLGDLVTALSLTYWLQDKERLWRYLAGFPEIIFEGHESPLEIEGRFSALGYTFIERLGVSERNRIVFYARRP